jgi:hypothetical protein
MELDIPAIILVELAQAKDSKQAKQPNKSNSPRALIMEQL